MTAAAIARLANVGRAAVSNWRRRYPTFPKPVKEGDGSTLFSRKEVEAWLVASGKADQLATAGRTDTGTQALDGAVSSESARVATADLSEPAAHDLSAGQLLARVMVSLLPDDLDTVDSDLPAVLDPACGEGTLLLAVADRFGDQVKLVGQELRPEAATTAAANVRAHPHDPPYEIHMGDSLLDDKVGEHRGSAAAVVCEPPLDLSRWPAEELAGDRRWRFGVPDARDGELAWVQHCYACLGLRGVAVVAVSPRTCVQPSGRHVRKALIESGVLRDVIALPAGMGSESDSDVYLWVLERPRVPSPPVRMVDLSGVGTTADIPQDHAAWRELFDKTDDPVCRSVPHAELLAGDVDLLPSRYLRPRVDVTADDLDRVTDRLRTLYRQIGRGLPRFTAARPSTHATVTLGQLEWEGALRIRSRDTPPRKGDVLLRTLGRPPVVATGTAADDSGVAQVLELDPSRLDAHFIATFLRADAAALPVANTLGALSREDLRRCRVPIMTRADQRRYGDAFRRLGELEETLNGLARVSANVITHTVHGLTTGALAPDPR
ncbi:type II restriction endonuclease subunit M [Saccharothrix sp. CB00851]|nr:type II restriction endonuclease subunit M [Saccharothrix sp. CB00851]